MISQLNDNIQSLEQTRQFLEEHTPFHEWLKRTSLEPFYQQNSTPILRALTHSSFTHENPLWNEGNNERLEFLGDALLDAEISYLLFRKFPELKEGDLSKIRSSVVNENVLAQWADDLNIGSFLFLGKGELQKKNVERAILADAFEALIGAVGVIDQKAPKDLIQNWIDLYDSSREEGELILLTRDRLDLFDPKTRLQELTLENFKELPEYTSEEIEEGFQVTVKVVGKTLATAKGKSKKKAEITAAKEVLIKKLVQKIKGEAL
jgi:ribonuclease III